MVVLRVICRGKVEYIGENDYLCRDIPPCGSLCLTIKEGAQLADRKNLFNTNHDLSNTNEAWTI